MDPIKPDVLEEAAHWLVEFRAGHPAPSERRDFDRWLRTSPEHVRAYLELLPAWEGASFPVTEQLPDRETLIQWARGADNNVVALGLRPVATGGAVPGRSKRLIYVAAAASVLAAVGAAMHFSQRTVTYSTATGQQTSIALPDGSTVDLNSRSRIEVRYTARDRSIELTAGQALFRVAQDPSRPFIVSSGDTRVRAVGTQFDVYRKSNGTTVTVLEGRVAVSSPKNPPSFLGAGEQVTATPVAALQSRTVDVKIATAWTRRRLIFSAAPLTEVAMEFNRYNDRPLVIASPVLEGLRINGVFSSADPSALVGFLREQPGIDVIETATGIWILSR